MTTDPTKDPTAGGGKVPPLSRNERRVLGLVAVLAVGVGGLGLISSFDAVEAAARDWGFGHPWMLPVGIDVAIPVFTAANLFLIRLDMELAWVRFVPWALTLVTCALNVATGEGMAKLAHGAMPLLWVVLSEVAAHTYANRIGAVTGTRMDKIRRSRWLLAFPSTFALWRRMTLWETTSYREALAMEKQRQLARADLLQKYGRRWRSKADRRTRVLLKLGELAPQDATASPAGQQQTAEPPGHTERSERSKAAEQQTPRTPRRRRTAKPKAKARKTGKAPRLSFEEHLAKAREVTATWQDSELNAEPIREAVGCGQDRSRQLRDVLKAERAQLMRLPTADTDTDTEITAEEHELEGAVS